WELEAMVAAVPDRRLWIAGPLENGAGLHFVVEALNPGSLLSTVLEKRHEREYGIKVRIDLVPVGTLYDRNVLRAVATVGRPRYVYSAAEMAAEAYLHNAKSGFPRQEVSTSMEKQTETLHKGWFDARALGKERADVWEFVKHATI